MTAPTGARRPTLADYARTVGNVDYLAALELLRLSPAVANYVAAKGGLRWNGRQTSARGRDPVPDVDLEWAAVAADLDENGTYLSTTEHRLLVVVLSLTVGRPMALSHLAGLGSWSDEAWRVLDTWRRL